MDDALKSFILTHENDNLSKLLLKQKEILGHPTSFVVNQINGRRRAKEKLPSWYAMPAITYPPQANLEQCSSELTAKFKAKIISRATSLSGGTTAAIADLTGGFGIDSLFFSRAGLKVFHVEPNHALCELASRSHEQLNAGAIEYVPSTAEEFLHQTNQKIDWIYIDPSRKVEGKKVYRLSDSQPDVVALLPSMFSKAENILIKTSPLLDLREGLKHLLGTREIYVVSVDNECKEVLFRLQRNWTAEPEIICVNIAAPANEVFQFKFSEEAKVESIFSEPEAYLYEPNASILKAGAFKMIAEAFDLKKISMNTHFYTAAEFKPEFPGRIFRVQSPLSFGEGKGLPAEAKVQEGVRLYNIISRNHPLSPEAIKKKYKLKDGGHQYLLAFSGVKKKFMVVAERLK